jgi:uncharacterized damage-inducible protein DinB
VIERYRTWYEHERDCNAKMLEMIASVPADGRSDPQFGRAVGLAAHLAACRENWLDRMTTGGANQGDWWPKDVAPETLRARFEALDGAWTGYLNALDDEDLARDFEFPASDGSCYRWSIEGQIFQLVGHAVYHRGQIALLVDQLGGKTVDTDYLYWAFPRDPRYGKIQADGEAK